MVMGIFFTLLGLATVVFAKSFAEHSIETRNRMWGLRLGPKSINISIWGARLTGVAFALFGVILIINS
jgi:hypothetical protein